ncbi:MAG: hypothetical protein KGN34_02340 [Sphingomonadales bacterium]|nr:hypothetical protein [Sphingomonadales bacterium]
MATSTQPSAARRAVHTPPADPASRSPLAWRPMQALLLVAGICILVPAFRSSLDPYGAAGRKGGVAVDTGGEAGRIEDGRFHLDLPLSVTNNTENDIVEVVMWITARDCPQAGSPMKDCRPLLSIGQDFPMLLKPGKSISLSKQFDGAAPPAARDGDTVRIERRIENIYDQKDAAKGAALDQLR